MEIFLFIFLTFYFGLAHLLTIIFLETFFFENPVSFIGFLKNASAKKGVSSDSDESWNTDWIVEDVCQKKGKMFL